MNLGIKHLSENIQASTAGVLWLTDDFLSLKSQGLYEFNYLLNGVLIENLNITSEQKISQKKQSFFLGTNFENPFFIGHVVIEEKEGIGAMHNHLLLAQTILKQNSEIFIFNRSKNTAGVNLLKELTTKYPQIKFLNLNI